MSHRTCTISRTILVSPFSALVALGFPGSISPGLSRSFVHDSLDLFDFRDARWCSQRSKVRLCFLVSAAMSLVSRKEWQLVVNCLFLPSGSSAPLWEIKSVFLDVFDWKWLLLGNCRANIHTGFAETLSRCNMFFRCRTEVAEECIMPVLLRIPHAIMLTSAFSAVELGKVE